MFYFNNSGEDIENLFEFSFWLFQPRQGNKATKTQVFTECEREYEKVERTIKEHE